MPTIHVNLNSFPQQEAAHAAPQVVEAGRSNPRMQGGPAPRGAVASLGAQPGLIPTGNAHARTAQRDAKTQTYQQEVGATSSRQQMPWDLLRGTPAYPGGTLQRGPTSETTDYTNRPPLRASQTQPRGGNPFREDAAPAAREGRARSHSADFWDSRALRVPRLEPAGHSHRSDPTQRGRGGQDSRVVAAIQPASSRETARSGNPFVSQETAFTPSHPFSPDDRALADPNHLLQTQAAQRQRAAPAQAQSQAAQTRGGGRPRQAAAVSDRRQPSALTQVALQSHTESARTFQNRREQTQAALLHPGSRAQATSAPAGPRAPTPPPVIPLSRFRSLPRTSAHHKSDQHRSGHAGHGQQPTKAATRGHAHTRGHAGHGRPHHGHAAHPQQRQTHRGRPR
ncbi:uncharacterized protein LOC109515437 [Hippocampus comes]|uniref:uncharacterized protein LOC109515437 n=1 Tax=Hippocampus comes TaxID=109280 RepID=UPI00094E31D6|nr:PREDICTED: uncharacterized protein LOC109515437 [Hippocampus comes]